LVRYAHEPDLAAAEFREVLVSSGLGDRRPVDDPARLEEMLHGAQLIVTARAGGVLVGVARAVTDFAYCCYLSDLAVRRERQRKGVGRRLVHEVRRLSGERCVLLLAAAPDAEAYYPRIGMLPLPSAWMFPRLR